MHTCYVQVLLVKIMYINMVSSLTLAAALLTCKLCIHFNFYVVISLV